MALDENSFSLAANFFGVISIAISLFALARYRGHLPAAQLCTLKLVLDDTEGIFRRGIEEGDFRDVELRSMLKNEVLRLRRIAGQYQVDVDRQPTVISQYRGWLQGLSGSISQIAEESRSLRMTMILVGYEEETQSRLHLSAGPDGSTRRSTISAPGPTYADEYETNNSSTFFPPVSITGRMASRTTFTKQIERRQDAFGEDLPTTSSKILDTHIAELSSGYKNHEYCSERDGVSSVSITWGTKYEGMLLEALLRSSEPLKSIRDSLYLALVLPNSGNSRHHRSGEYNAQERKALTRLFDFYSQWTRSNYPSAMLHRIEHKGNTMDQFMLEMKEQADSLLREQPLDDEGPFVDVGSLIS